MLKAKRHLGNMTTETKTKYVDREIPRISLRDFTSRIDEITAELVTASENVGFFSITDHGISTNEIEAAFEASRRFFDLPDEVKATVPFSTKNVGWEKNAQIRPSTGQPDTKESYQMQFGENMNNAWIKDDQMDGFHFKEAAKSFMAHVQEVSERLMICFARGLGFPDDYFIKYHDVSRPNAQTTLRFLRYFSLPRPNDRLDKNAVYHRAGAHADWDFLTLLFQRDGQTGLEICPGREAVTEFGAGDEWTPVEPKTGEIICNIGDLLMSWSDDRFKSTIHRVKAPHDENDYYGDRYSIAYFNQPCSDALIQGPLKKYPLITGQEFTARAMKRNFAAVQEKQRTLAAAAAAAA